MSTEISTATKPSTSIVIVTPEMALRWLEKNTNNRPVARIVVERYKRDMLAGLWQFTNAGVAFDVNGDLIDGQHRLLAISELPAGNGIALNVTRGLAPEARFFIDQGRKRTSGQQLAMAGNRNYNHTASGVRLHLIWKTGILFRDTKQAQLITSPQIQEWVQANADLVELANQSQRDLVKSDANPSVARAAFFAFAAIDPMDAALFFSKLHSGAGLDEGDPILALSQRLATDRRNKRRRTEREQLGMVIAIWNAWRAGRKLKTVPIRAWTAATFPEPK